MQVFMPYLDPVKCAMVLDYRRLGKQRVESKQLLQNYLDVDKFGMNGNTGQSYDNHPIHQMWLGHEEALMSYTYYIIKEWKERGYRDSILPWMFSVAHRRGLKIRPWEKVDKPWWHGDPKLHVLHRANLLVKDPMWYGTQPANLGLKPWVIPDRLRSGFGYNWPLTEAGQWRTIRRDER